jgi:hypothetical protein
MLAYEGECGNNGVRLPLEFETPYSICFEAMDSDALVVYLSTKVPTRA